MIRQLLKFVTSKLFVASVIVFSQVIIAIITFYTLRDVYTFLEILFRILGIVFVFYVINKEGDNTFKIGWITLILLFPYVGTIFYIMFSNYRTPRKLKILDRFEQEQPYKSNDDGKILSEIEKNDLAYLRQFTYLSQYIGLPAFENQNSTFLNSGEAQFEMMLHYIQKAKKFIFLDYFIIAKGKMWDTILEALKLKVKEGVEVIVLYDEMGCISTLPSFYDEELRSYGIKCHVFNPLRITPAIQLNYRNHCKIFIVDGQYAITGGVNLADEYINEIVRFGHWKDSAVLIEGASVWTFTLAFLRVYSYLSQTSVNYFDYQNNNIDVEKKSGYLIPYYDSPTYDEHIGRDVHMNLIRNAKKYIYINSPYVILDQAIKDALILAAESGVDVRILIPKIPDKIYAYLVTKSNCRLLLKHGVKVYEYLPGFNHSKAFVVDDVEAVVGTVNMDYRSYYLHYECGVYFYRCDVVLQVKEDFIASLEKSREVSYEEYANVSLLEKIAQFLLTVFSPIL